MDEDIITINGDDLFYADLIRKLIGRQEDIVMAISRKEVYDDDDMKVITEGDMVRAVGKGIPLTAANGESIGIIKYSRRGAHILRDELEAMVKRGTHRNDFYLKTLQALMDRNVMVNHQEFDDSLWQEMDFHQDLELAKRIFEEKYREFSGNR